MISLYRGITWSSSKISSLEILCLRIIVIVVKVIIWRLQTLLFIIKSIKFDIVTIL